MSSVVAVHLTDHADAPYVGIVVRVGHRWVPTVKFRGRNFPLPACADDVEASDAVRADWQRRASEPPPAPPEEPDHEDLATVVDDLQERHEARVGSELCEVEP